MYKLEIDCYGGTVIVETEFINFASAVGQLIKNLQDKDVLDIQNKDIGDISAIPNAPVKKRGRPAGSGKKTK